jgi:Sfi1 spindle body protein
VLRVAIHKWRAALAQRRERAVCADARANAYRRKAALVRWHVRLQERRKAAWRADMRTRMQTVRSLRDAAMRRDAWARWRQLYQSRLLQQRFSMSLVERCFERWKGKLREIISMKRRADEFVVMREGEAAGRCWDFWRRGAELRSAERAIAERVGARVVGETMAFWRQRTYAVFSPSRTRTLTCLRRREHQRANALYNAAVKQLAFIRWRNAHSRILVSISTRIGVAVIMSTIGTGTTSRQAYSPSRGCPGSSRRQSVESS